MSARSAAAWVAECRTWVAARAECQAWVVLLSSASEASVSLLLPAPNSVNISCSCDGVAKPAWTGHRRAKQLVLLRMVHSATTGACCESDGRWLCERTGEVV